MKSNKLFDLILSMSRAEKGFFKKNAKLYGSTDSQYLKLFEAIDKQDKYDEVKLLKKFKKDSFIKHFHVTKNYLFGAILSSLKNYRTSKSKKSQLEQLKMEIEILIERSLYEEADKLIQKVKKQAYAIEYFEVLLTVLKLERYMCTVYEPYKKMHRKNDVRNEVKAVLAHLQNQEYYLQQSDDLMEIHLYGEYNNSEEKQSYIAQIMEQDQLQDETLATTFESKRKFWQAHLVAATLQQESARMLYCSEQVVQLWERYAIQQQEQPYTYCVTLSNYLASAQYNPDEIDSQEYLTILNKIKAQEIHSLPLKILQYSIYFFDRLILMHLSSNFEELDQVVEEINQFLKKYNKLVNTKEKRELIYIICGLYIIVGKPDQALHWSLAFEQLPKSTLQSFIYFSVELFSVFAHFQHKNIEVVLSKIRSIQRQLKKQEKVYAIQKLVLQMLSKIETLAFTYNTKDLWLDYIQKFEELLKIPEEQYALGNFDIVTWIKAQMEHSTMAEIYKKSS
ncbi:MAG: hypothetical protein GY810_03490 [Aureispira sp.]|nr:hypothetical protein [Aureispira sp.]